MADEAKQCGVTGEDISAYLDGELSGIDSARVESHLKKCHDCAREKDLLRECSKRVGGIVERRPSAALESVLKRRSQDYLDGFRARQRRSRMALAARAWARRALLTTLLVAAAASGIYVISRLRSARLAELNESRQMVSPAQTLSPGRTIPTVGVIKPMQEKATVAPVMEDAGRPPESIAGLPPKTRKSDYTGWWRTSFGSPPADMGFVKFVQDGTTVAIPGDSYVNGQGRLDGRRILITRADERAQGPFELEAELDTDGRDFAGTAITTYDGGRYRSSVAIFGEKVAAELAAALDAEAKRAETVVRRQRRLGKLYAVLKEYAREHGGALPDKLAELTPAYLDGPSFAVSEPGIREIEYVGGSYLPSPQEVRSLSDASADLTTNEALELYAESAEQRVAPFFTELASESWTIAPSGRAVLHLDGTTAWQTEAAAEPAVPQALLERREKQRMLACQDNMKKLGAALGRWLREWEGTYPLNLGSLYPEWLSDLAVLTCPEAESHTICHELVYTGEPRPAEEDFASPEAAAEYYATVPVVIEIGEPHFGGHNVLYMDGHTEWHPASERY